MPKVTVPRSTSHGIPPIASSSKLHLHRVPDQTHDYRLSPNPYPALKTEQGVFTTPPYSAEIKGVWRYKNEKVAEESSVTIWGMFETYRSQDDFIGADTARKFIQMGRTRSLRYALRPGGKKYEVDGDTGEKKAMERTGKVYDQRKLDGAGVFEKVLKRCWEDEWYQDKFKRWKAGEREQKRAEEERDEEISDAEKRIKGSRSATAEKGGDTGSEAEDESGEELVEVKEESP